jgi:hypothetical protein
MTNPTDRRSFGDRLKDAGVTYVEYKSWMRQPAFASLIENFASRALGDHLAVAHDSLLKQVEKGNTRALEFYYEMTGVYSRGSQQERDVQAVLTGVIDIIQRNVQDQETLALIADEIKILMGGPVSTPMALTAFRDPMGVEDAQFTEVVETEFSERKNEPLKLTVMEEENAVQIQGGWDVKIKDNKVDKVGIVNIIPPVADFKLKLNLEE